MDERKIVATVQAAINRLKRCIDQVTEAPGKDLRWVGVVLSHVDPLVERATNAIPLLLQRKGYVDVAEYMTAYNRLKSDEKKIRVEFSREFRESFVKAGLEPLPEHVAAIEAVGRAIVQKEFLEGWLKAATSKKDYYELSLRYEQSPVACPPWESRIEQVSATVLQKVAPKGAGRFAKSVFEQAGLDNGPHPGNVIPGEAEPKA